jgi:hypothetical protein
VGTVQRKKEVIKVGDGADMAIENGFDDCEEYEAYLDGNFSPQEAYDRGIVDELGREYPTGLRVPCATGNTPQRLFVSDKEWVKRCKEKVYGCTVFASNVRGVIAHYYKYREISEKQRKMLIAYWLSDEAEDCREEYELKWGIPF